MNTLLQWAGIVVAIVLAALAITGSMGSPAAGNTTSSFWDASSYKISGTTVHSASVLKTTTAGGTLTIATSNTATSTIIGGCYQFYATSTATAQKFMASTTPGIMYSQYGTCP